jgi:hypothetical protein
MFHLQAHQAKKISALMVDLRCWDRVVFPITGQALEKREQKLGYHCIHIQANTLFTLQAHQVRWLASIATMMPLSRFGVELSISGTKQYRLRFMVRIFRFV